MGSPLYDPGLELCFWEGESNASITKNGMGKTKEVRCISAAAAVILRYPNQVAPIDSILTDSCCIMQLVHVQFFSSHAADMIRHPDGSGCLIK